MTQFHTPLLAAIMPAGLLCDVTTINTTNEGKIKMEVAILSLSNALKSAAITSSASSTTTPNTVTKCSEEAELANARMLENTYQKEAAMAKYLPLLDEKPCHTKVLDQCVSMLAKGGAEHVFKFCMEAHQQGSPSASLVLGIMHEEGMGVPENPSEALQFYREAAKREQPHACLNIWYRYVHCGDIDRSEAVKNLEIAAEKGLAQAQITLAEAYRDGSDGVEKNGIKALQLCQELSKNASWETLPGKGVDRYTEQKFILSVLKTMDEHELTLLEGDLLEIVIHSLKAEIKG